MLAAAALLSTLCLAPAPQAASQPPERGHGPDAPSDKFAHVFRLKAHQPARPQLSFHYGLLQPVLLRGFNAAVDVRYKRFIATYSHGHGLEVDRAPGVLSSSEQAAGVRALMPYTTGGGVGAVLIDELYVLADVKVHGVDVRYAGGTTRYHTVTVGAEVGWRLFLWKGLHVTPVIRYWPNVHTTLPGDRLQLDDGVTHRALTQGTGGLFANVLIGWSFGL